MVYLALDVASAAVFTRLNVAALTTLLNGGVQDDMAQGKAFPFVWYEVRARNIGGLGDGEMAEVELRTHTFTNTPGMKTAQQIDAVIQERLRNQRLAIDGYNHCGTVFYDDTFAVPDSEINGVKVHEVVSMFRIAVEAQ